MSKKIIIKHRDHSGVILSIQENINGVFQTPQEVKIEKQEIMNLSFNDIMEILYSSSASQEDLEKKVKMPQNYNTFILSFFKMNNISMKNKISLLLGVLIFITVIILSTMIPSRDPETIKAEIKTLRTDREKQYNSCTAVCDAERGVFDAKIIKNKAELSRAE